MKTTQKTNILKCPCGAIAKDNSTGAEPPRCFVFIDEVEKAFDEIAGKLRGTQYAEAIAEATLRRLLDIMGEA